MLLDHKNNDKNCILKKASFEYSYILVLRMLTTLLRGSIKKTKPKKKDFNLCDLLSPPRTAPTLRDPQLLANGARCFRILLSSLLSIFASALLQSTTPRAPGTSSACCCLAGWGSLYGTTDKERISDKIFYSFFC